MQLQSRNLVRRRGVTLTDLGLRKLNQAKVKTEMEHNFKRFTLEVLSEQTGLTPTTLSKVFTGSSGVDKRTLKCCFDAFNLTLLTEDYSYRKLAPDNFAEISSMLSAETCSMLSAETCSNLKSARDHPCPRVMTLSLICQKC